jgi:hypothetical protein
MMEKRQEYASIEGGRLLESTNNPDPDKLSRDQKDMNMLGEGNTYDQKVSIPYHSAYIALISNRNVPYNISGP